MPFLETPIKDLIVFEPKVFEDERGHFYESYNWKTFQKGGIITNFVQDNQSLSKYSVLRGLHYQVAPFAQAKLVRVLQGEVLDVAVDLRERSETYKQWFSIHLSGENRRQLFIPRGFAHGFVALSETATFFYKCDNYYSKAYEGGIAYDDPTLAINWEIDDLIVSEKDQELPNFGEHRKFN